MTAAGVNRESARGRDVDRHFAELMMALAEKPSSGLYKAAWLASLETGMGHSCVDLGALAGKSLPMAAASRDDGAATAPDLDAWCRALRQSGVVGAPGDNAPLILDADGRLYLARYWQFECELALDLAKRAASTRNIHDRQRLREDLLQLFPGSAGGASIDWQQLAAAVAVCRQLTIVSGGPGTGKTYVVARVLALLLRQAQPQALRIALAAPTGKAAVRLAESIRGAAATLTCAQSIKDLMPREASTIHRLLRPTARGGGFRHGRTRPLDIDVLVVDECSMVDLPLMARLLAALPEQARLILLGDKDQLASVEAGSVFADICGGQEETRLSQEFAATVSALLDAPLEVVAAKLRIPLEESIVVLTRGHRFATGSGIASLARAVRENDVNAMTRLLEEGGDGVSRHSIDTPRRRDALQRRLVGRYADLLRGGFGEERAGRLLAALSRLKVLCALRQGPYGVEQVNRWIGAGLRAEGVISGDQEWYAGRPVMITRNDYGLGLYNGDLGLLLVAADGSLRAVFERADGITGARFTAVAPTRLPPHQTAFAMTVHKSQGSEFERVVLIVPDQDAPVITRELVYTAITRARHHVELWGSSAAIVRAANRRESRRGGLREKLWGASGRRPEGRP